MPNAGNFDEMQGRQRRRRRRPAKHDESTAYLTSARRLFLTPQVCSRTRGSDVGRQGDYMMQHSSPENGHDDAECRCRGRRLVRESRDFRYFAAMNSQPRERWAPGTYTLTPARAHAELIWPPKVFRHASRAVSLHTALRPGRAPAAMGGDGRHGKERYRLRYARR